jgi:hypothetical protein
MMKAAVTVLVAVLLGASGALAQAPKASDEAKVDREKARAAFAKARQACEGKQDQERRDCMRREVCAQAKDPAACEVRVKEAAARHAKAREACKGKTGEELKTCIREQRSKTSKK